MILTCVGAKMLLTFRLFLGAASFVILALAVIARGLVPVPEVRTRIGEVRKCPLSVMAFDNDGAYGPTFRRRVRALGIRDRPISTRSPWQNPYAERLIGTLRRSGPRCHLRCAASAAGSGRVSRYYNQTRTHLSLDKDAPLGRSIQRPGAIIAAPVLSGLHHCYSRI